MPIINFEDYYKPPKPQPKPKAKYYQPPKPPATKKVMASMVPQQPPPPQQPPLPQYTTLGQEVGSWFSNAWKNFQDYRKYYAENVRREDALRASMSAETRAQNRQGFQAFVSGVTDNTAAGNAYYQGANAAQQIYPMYTNPYVKNQAEINTWLSANPGWSISETGQYSPPHTGYGTGYWRGTNANYPQPYAGLYTPWATVGAGAPQVGAVTPPSRAAMPPAGKYGRGQFPQILNMNSWLVASQNPGASYRRETLAELLARGAVDPWGFDPYEIGGSPYRVETEEPIYEDDGGYGWGSGWGGGGSSYGASSGINSYLPGTRAGYGASASSPRYNGYGGARGSSYAGGQYNNQAAWRMPMLVWNI